MRQMVFDSSLNGLAQSSLFLIGKPNSPQSSFLGERRQRNEQAPAMFFEHLHRSFVKYL